MKHVLYPAQTLKRTKKELSNSYIKPLTYRCPIVLFYRKRGLGSHQSHYNQSRLWSRLHTTPAQITRITPEWIYTEYTVLKIFSLFRIFEQLALAMKNSVPWIHCTEYIFFMIQDFWATCACPQKQSVPWIQWIENIFFTIQVFWATCAFPENRVCPEFTVLNIYLYHSAFSRNLRLPWKQSLPWNSSSQGGCRNPPPPRTPMHRAIAK